MYQVLGWGEKGVLMGDGWKVDVAASQAVIDGAARAGSSMQVAAIEVDTALRDVVAAVTGTDASGAAQGFVDARQGDATSAVRGIEQAITAATSAMNAFANADTDMAASTTAASNRTGGSGKR
jgi:hypothetical protein